MQTSELESPRTGGSAGLEFARKYRNMLCELRLSTGIHKRIERLMDEFAAEHPNVRASYVSRDVDESYFADGACGWEPIGRPKLQGVALEGETLFEFLAFQNGFRSNATPSSTILNVEELWLETAPEAPFTLRVCLYHSYPATTILTATTGEAQEAATAFVSRLKYLRGV